MGKSNSFILFQTGEKQNCMLVSNSCCLETSGTPEFYEAFQEHFSEMWYIPEILF